MDKQELKQKLINNGLDKYISIFEENHLFDEAVLKSLTNEDYISIGITILGDRKKLQLLFNNTEKNIKEPINEKEKQEENKDVEEKDEYINIIRNGKEFCYKSSELGKLLCRKCHAAVSEGSTLCWNCNNNLVEQKYSSPIVNDSSSSKNENSYAKYVPSKKINKTKIIVSIIVAIILIFITYTCLSEGSVSSKNLRGISTSLSTTQLKLNTDKTLHNLKIKINGDYTYTESILPSGTYTVGLAAFADSEGNRFNPFIQKITRISIFCDEGSTYFTPN